MFDFIDEIMEIFPSNWLFKLKKESTGGTTGVDIRHPNNPEIYLEIMIIKERTGIAVFQQNSAEELLLDLGGFDYSFEKDEVDKLRQFLEHFRDTGELL